jgi:hypothetical protein
MHIKTHGNILWKPLILRTALDSERIIISLTRVVRRIITLVCVCVCVCAHACFFFVCFFVLRSTLIPLVYVICLSIVRLLQRESIIYTVECVPNLVTCKIFFCSEILNKCHLMCIWCLKYVLGLERCDTLWRKHEYSFKKVVKVKAVRI